MGEFIRTCKYWGGKKSLHFLLHTQKRKIGRLKGAPNIVSLKKGAFFEGSCFSDLDNRFVAWVDRKDEISLVITTAVGGWSHEGVVLFLMILAFLNAYTLWKLLPRKQNRSFFLRNPTFLFHMGIHGLIGFRSIEWIWVLPEKQHERFVCHRFARDISNERMGLHTITTPYQNPTCMITLTFRSFANTSDTLL